MTLRSRSSRTLRLVAVVCVIVPLVAAGTATATADTSSDASSDAVRVVAATPDAAAQQAATLVAAMSARQKAASVLMMQIGGTDPATLREFMASTGVGGFIFMGANVPATESELRAITEAMTVDPALPPLLAVDQEGGDVSRLRWDDFPSAITLKNEGPDAAALAFSGRGALVARAGLGVNFGVVADVAPDPGSFIYRRALGTDPAAAAERVSAASAGEAPFAATTLKHFPGHGAAPGDSHSSIPSSAMSLEQWRTTEAVPFQAGIEAGAPLVMFGHLAYTSVDSAPASLSAEWHRILREDLGFTGIAITDDMGMLLSSGVPAYTDPVANGVAALAAGNDMILWIAGADSGSADQLIGGIEAALASGALPAARLEEAATRVVTLRLRLAAEGRGAMPCADCAPVG